MNPFMLALLGMTTNMFLVQSETIGKMFVTSVLAPSLKISQQRQKK